jgi:solute carrier family 25 carnitine/acylcarnitine transporter 20/29
MASPMVGVAIVNSLLFAIYGSALRWYAKDSENPSVSDIFLAGCISGGVNGFFSCPMELIKIRLQNQTNIRGGKDVLYKGPVDCIRKIIQKGGYRGLFQGLNTTLVREIPSYGAYFASYDFFCKTIPSADPNVPSLGILLAGGTDPQLKYRMCWRSRMVIYIPCGCCKNKITVHTRGSMP